MNEEIEKLSGEVVVALMCPFCKDSYKAARGGFGCRWPDDCIDEAKESITRIGKAYADGMELPGEVARVDTSNPKQWQLIKLFREPGVWMTNRWDAGARIFIALKGGNK